MSKGSPLPEQEILDILKEGTVIPAHPLALTRERKLDEKRQKGLTRYYIEAGVGGIAVVSILLNLKFIIKKLKD